MGCLDSFYVSRFLDLLYKVISYTGCLNGFYVRTLLDMLYRVISYGVGLHTILFHQKIAWFFLQGIISHINQLYRVFLVILYAFLGYFKSGGLKKQGVDGKSKFFLNNKLLKSVVKKDILELFLHA